MQNESKLKMPRRFNHFLLDELQEEFRAQTFDSKLWSKSVRSSGLEICSNALEMLSAKTIHLPRVSHTITLMAELFDLLLGDHSGESA